LDNFILIGILGVLALYFYSSMSIYKAMYRRIVEEKNLAQESVKSLEHMISKYEAQVHNSIATINDSQDSLKVAREDLQRIKVVNNDLEHRNQRLQERVDELYSSVGAL